jgi:hypothetical protein
VRAVLTSLLYRGAACHATSSSWQELLALSYRDNTVHTVNGNRMSLWHPRVLL